MFGPHFDGSWGCDAPSLPALTTIVSSWISSLPGPTQTLTSLISPTDAIKFSVSTLMGTYANIVNDIKWFDNNTFSEARAPPFQLFFM